MHQKREGHSVIQEIHDRIPFERKDDYHFLALHLRDNKIFWESMDASSSERDNAWNTQTLKGRA